MTHFSPATGKVEVMGREEGEGWEDEGWEGGRMRSDGKGDCVVSSVVVVMRLMVMVVMVIVVMVVVMVLVSLYSSPSHLRLSFPYAQIQHR